MKNIDFPILLFQITTKKIIFQLQGHQRIGVQAPQFWCPPNGMMRMTIALLEVDQRDAPAKPGMKGISSQRVQPYQSYFKWNSSMHNHHHCCFIIASFNHISDGIKIFMIIITIYYYNSSSASYSSSKGFPIFPQSASNC